MVQFIRLRGDFGLPVGFGFYRSGRTDGRTASQLLALREAARMVPDCAQPIILAYGTCASAKISRHSAGAWLTRIAPKSKSTSTNCAYPPIKFEVSTQY